MIRRLMITNQLKTLKATGLVSHSHKEPSKSFQFRFPAGTVVQTIPGFPVTPMRM
jgi:hypothetical protein